jgi:thioredoxin-like negative regulator of GroEL
MVARCHWELHEPAAALDALAAADRRFPAEPSFAKQRVLYLLELGLFLEASQAGRSYLQRAGESAGAYLTLGEALRRSRRPRDAAQVLEQGRLRYGDDTKLLVALAHAYLDAGQPRAAGQIMERASLHEERYSTEAAELYRRAGDIARALYINIQATDQRAKARQRLGLLLQLGCHAQAAALDPRLERLGLLEEEDVRYAMAYSLFRAGDLDHAAARLRGITRSDLFRAATDLRKAIDAERSRSPDR